MVIHFERSLFRSMINFRAPSLRRCFSLAANHDVREKERRYWERLMKSEQRVLDARRLQTKVFRVRTPSPGRWLFASKPQIPLRGVTYIPEFLDLNEQKYALDIIDSAPWAGFVARRQQYWGEIYYHTTKDVAAIQPVAAEHSAAHSLPMQKFKWLLEKLYADQIYREVHN